MAAGCEWVGADERVRLVIALKRRDGRRCRGCGKRFRGRRNPTVDHCVPRSRGGTNALRNLRLLCARCNSRKSNHLPGEAGWPPELLLPLPVLMLPATVSPIGDIAT